VDPIPLASRHAPQGIKASDGLRELSAKLDQLLSPDKVTAATVDASATAASTLLRQRLAVRGWVSPSDLMLGITQSDAAAALRIVGREVELAERQRIGQWFMTLTARKRVFASTDIETLWKASEQLLDDDETDPVRLALRLAIQASDKQTGTPPDAIVTKIGTLPDNVLRELSLMRAWGSAIHGLDALAASASAQLRRRSRDRELDLFGGAAIFGREREQQRIRNFLAEPADWNVRVLYVSGIGGSGKSTLLLAAEQELRKLGKALIVRLDFDNGFLDPLNPEQMDMMFLRALSVEDPAFAPVLQRIIVQLTSLMEHRMRARIDAEGEPHRSIPPGKQLMWGESRAKYAPRSGSDAERAGISEQYERLSALGPLGSMPELRDRGVVLFLDTVENVSRRGADAVDSVLEWLSSLGNILSGRHLRVVVAGRDTLGAPSMRALANRFQDFGLALLSTEEVNLGDLDAGAARDMLQHCGMPAADAALASTALPRNPLVLRLAANAYAAAKDDVSAIQEGYRAGRIDRQTASGYLAQRVIQHVPRLPARRYAVAALAMESVSERVLRDIVIPAVDGVKMADRKLARRVYEGLRRATWLTSEDQPGTLRWHTELRNLALPMIEAEPSHAEVSRRVHSAASVWQSRRRSAREPGQAEHHLARAMAEPPSGRTAGMQATPLHGADDELHRMQLEGIGAGAGEGDRLVAQGRGVRALELYRDRPTRARGIPPTFVIRALAQTGDWNNDDVEAEKVLDELRRHINIRAGNLQRVMAERLYWLTRLELLRQPGLSRSHVEVLRDACRGLKFTRSNGALFGLVATTEALQSADCSFSPIAPASWPPLRADVGPELRFSMVRTAYDQLPSREGRGGSISTTLVAMLRLDEDWVDDLVVMSERAWIRFQDGAGLLHDLKSQFQSLRAATLAQVEQFVSSCRDIRVSIDLARIPPGLASRLMRGTLVEFHSPLSTLLSAPSLKLSVSGLMRFVRELQGAPRAVLPVSELESDVTSSSNWRNVQPKVTAVIVALDRARLLAEFCRALERSPGQLLASGDSYAVQRVLEVCRRYLAWDRALDPQLNAVKQAEDV
jgi:hypothetical protein